MKANDFANAGAETTDNNDDSDESISYVEISSVDHPTAWEIVKGGGPLRSHFKNTTVSHHDLFAAIAEPIKAMIVDGDKQPMLEWVLTDSEGNVDNDALAEFVDNYKADPSGDEADGGDDDN